MAYTFILNENKTIEQLHSQTYSWNNVLGPINYLTTTATVEL